MKGAVVWSYLMQYSQMIVTFVTSIILARMLSPEEVGIYSVSFALIGFATLLRDFGISDYIVKEQALTAEKIQTAFTFNNLMSWSLGLIVFFSADWVASLYGKPEIAQVFHLLALNFVFVPMGAVTFATLRKEMNFKAITHIQMYGIFTTAGVSIYAAFLGQSYLSMAWGAISGAMVTAIVSQFYRPFKLSFRPSLTAIKSIWQFTSHSISINILRYTSQSLGEILTGKFLGVGDVGLLSKSKTLPNMVNQLVSGGLKPTIMPTFAKIQQDKALVSHQYFKVVNFTIGLVWPALLFLGFMSEEIVLFLFGQQWLGVAALIKVTCCGIAIWSAISYADEVFKATGYISTISKLEPLFLLIIATGAIIGSQISILAVVAFGAASVGIRLIIYVFLMHKKLQINARDHFKILATNGLMVIALYALLVLISVIVSVDNLLLKLMCFGTCYLVIWCFMMKLCKHQAYQLISPLFSSVFRHFTVWQKPQ